MNRFVRVILPCVVSVNSEKDPRTILAIEDQSIIDAWYNNTEEAESKALIIEKAAVFIDAITMVYPACLEHMCNLEMVTGESLVLLPFEEVLKRIDDAIVNDAFKIK